MELMSPMFAILNTNELIIIAIIVLLLFGGAKIPQLMRGLGRGMGEFQKGVAEGKRSLEAMKAEAEKAGDDKNE